MRSRRLWSTAAAIATGVLAAVLLAAPAAAVPGDDPLPPQATNASADIEIVGVENGSTVTGAIVSQPVPPTSYPAGGTGGAGQFAALIVVRDVDSAQESRAYCIDFLTGTSVGVRYSDSDWTAAGVDNASYITYILTNYFPFNSAAPAGTPEQKVAAVQSAIWFFSDSYVLDAADPARPAAAAIVADALANGGSTPPPTPPSLAIDPADANIPGGGVAGPFTVTGDAAAAVLEDAAGLQLSFDQAGTQPATVGSPTPAGTTLWASAVAEQVPPASFTIGTDFPVSVGTVYVADPDPDQYQKLVLARTDTLPVRVSAAVSVYAAGDVDVVKQITGEGAGLQGAVTIELRCTPAPPPSVVTTWTIPAGTEGEVRWRAVGIPVETTCTVAETADGADAAVRARAPQISPAQVTIASDGTVPVVTVVNTYDPVTPILPVTGPADLTPATLAGAGLIAMGAVALVVARRLRHPGRVR